MFPSISRKWGASVRVRRSARSAAFFSRSKWNASFREGCAVCLVLGPGLSHQVYPWDQFDVARQGMLFSPDVTPTWYFKLHGRPCAPYVFWRLFWYNAVGFHAAICGYYWHGRHIPFPQFLSIWLVHASGFHAAVGVSRSVMHRRVFFKPHGRPSTRFRLLTSAWLTTVGFDAAIGVSFKSHGSDTLPPLYVCLHLFGTYNAMVFQAAVGVSVKPHGRSSTPFIGWRLFGTTQCFFTLQ